MHEMRAAKRSRHIQSAQHASELAKSLTTLHWNIERSSPPTLTTYLPKLLIELRLAS